MSTLAISLEKLSRKLSWSKYYMSLQIHVEILEFKVTLLGTGYLRGDEIGTLITGHPGPYYRILGAH